MCPQVFDTYPDHDLSSKKDFIKQTVKSVRTHTHTQQNDDRFKKANNTRLLLAFLNLNLFVLFSEEIRLTLTQVMRV